MNEISINEALSLGVEAHKSGNFRDAERYYRAILQNKPTHADANHNLGILAFGNNKPNAALPFFRIAVNLNAKVEQYWISYIECLTKLHNFNFAQIVLKDALNNKIQTKKINKLYQFVDQKILEKNEKSIRDIVDLSINLRDTGKIDEAIETLQDGLNNFPKEVELLALICHCFMILTETAKAADFLNKAKVIDKKNKLVQLNEARLLLTEGKISEAILVAQRLYNEHPKYDEALGILGSCLRVEGKINESLSCIEKALKINENYAEGLITRGLIRALQNDSSGAATDLERGFYLKPFIKQIWKPIINIKLEAKRYIETAEFILKIIEFNEPEDEYFQKLIFCIQHFDETTQAIDFLNRSILLAPEQTMLHMTLGLILSKKGDYRSALKAFNRVIKVNPLLEHAHFQIGFILQNSGDLISAVKSYKKATKLNPKLAEAHYNLGITLHEIREYNAAIENYKKTIKLNPNWAEAHYNLGITLHEIHEYSAAIENYKKAIKLNPNWAEAHYNMANALKDLSRNDEAIDKYQHAIKHKPNFTAAFLNLGVIFKDTGRYDDAIENYTKVLELKPCHSDATKNLVNVLTIHRPKTNLKHPIMETDHFIRSKFSKIGAAGEIKDFEVTEIVTSCFQVFNKTKLNFHNDLSQMYRRSSTNLNCDRHLSIFNKHGVIPEFCFNCFKVQVEPSTCIELIKLVIVFDHINQNSQNTRKCMVETRPEIPGSYKGLIYCRGHDEAKGIADALQIIINERIGQHLTCKIKRGCSEYQFLHSEFPIIENDGSTKFQYNSDWKEVEHIYDKKNNKHKQGPVTPTKQGFSLSDFFVIQTWIDYAVENGDQSVSKLVVTS